MALPERRFHRARLWFGHPNLLAHTVAIAVVAIALLPGPTSAAVAGLSSGGLILLAAGSRTALGLSLAFLIWIWARRLPRQWRLATVAASATIAVAGGWLLGPSLGRLDPTLTLGGNGVNAVSRPEIWSVAWQAVISEPWRGLDVPFADLFAEQHAGPSYASASHAHNFWLGMGSSYGVPGLAGALVFSIAALRLSLQRAGRSGLLLTVLVLMMNVFDISLFYTNALCIWILGINALAHPPPAPRLDLREAGSG